MRNPYDRPDLIQLGQAHFKKFVATITQVVLREQQRIDVIFGAGNTGAGLARCTALIYEHFGMPAPPIIKLPIYRYRPNAPAESDEFLFDNSPLIPDLERQLRECAQVERILFVDDEIGEGTTLVITAQLFLRALARRQRSGSLVFIVVAEDQGFAWRDRVPGVTVRFFPYAEEVAGLNNLISYGIPYDLYAPITARYADSEIDSKERFNILLGEPIKALHGGRPVFTDACGRRLAGEIANLDALQAGFSHHIRELIAATGAEKSKNTLESKKAHSIRCSIL